MESNFIWRLAIDQFQK